MRAAGAPLSAVYVAQTLLSVPIKSAQQLDEFIDAMPACRGRDRNLILLESSDVLLDRIASIHDRFLSRAALSDATREARTLGDPLTVLSSANDDLAHGSDCRISAWRCQSIHKG